MSRSCGRSTVPYPETYQSKIGSLTITEIDEICRSLLVNGFCTREIGLDSSHITFLVGGWFALDAHFFHPDEIPEAAYSKNDTCTK